MLNDTRGIQVLANVNVICGVKPGQYLDHKDCVCKNKLVGRLIEECTNVINETKMNNNNDNDYDYNTIIYVFIGFFYSQSFVFVCSLILSGLKIKNYLKINMLIIKMYNI